MKSNIVLIGFMGVGKTTIGKKLASRLKKIFYDSDQEIETDLGMSISEIFDRFGEAVFRVKENSVIERLAEYENSVIATGGGVVLNQNNMNLLAKKGIIVCLTAKPEIIYERVKNDQNLPLLKKGDIYQTILALLAQREKLYSCADFYIDTSYGEYPQIVEKIVDFVEEYQQKQIQESGK